MVLEDAFSFCPGDFTIFYAVTLELMVRKLLQESGYDQKSFGTHVDMSEPINSGYGIHPDENVGPAADFIKKALTFAGCRVRSQYDQEDRLMMAVKLPKGMCFLSNKKAKALRQLNSGPFDDSYYEVRLGKKDTVFYCFDEEFGYDWRCFSHIVQGILELIKGGFIHGSADNAA